ncbi:MAG: hypothetical protein EOP84_37050 [Verrucomicrobiaceae bacterium]|nr:MAG: hypothetical protein EOP84_37050 [Verrucomicrobiaceae bacterium]
MTSPELIAEYRWKRVLQSGAYTLYSDEIRVQSSDYNHGEWDIRYPLREIEGREQSYWSTETHWLVYLALAGVAVFAVWYITFFLSPKTSYTAGVWATFAGVAVVIAPLLVSAVFCRRVEWRGFHSRSGHLLFWIPNRDEDSFHAFLQKLNERLGELES